MGLKNQERTCLLVEMRVILTCFVIYDDDNDDDQKPDGWVAMCGARRLDA